MRLLGTRFGNVDFTAEDIVAFEDGLIGFPTLTHFILLSPKPDSPFRWLQSIEDPSMAFLLAEPLHFFPSYRPQLSLQECKALSMAEDTPRLVYVTTSIPPGKPKEMTVNLLAPIVLNIETRKGKQVILGDDAYTIKHRVLQAEGKEAETIAA
jgi:flagellar assembly factor FliW